MYFLKRFLIFIFLAMLGHFGLATEAYACSCLAPDANQPVSEHVQGALKSTDAVFAGTVLEVTKRPDLLYVAARIKVKASWKGLREEETEVVVTSGRGGGDCGFPFEAGKKYLIYANRSDKGQLGTNICLRTAEHAKAKEDLAVLGEPAAKQ